MNREISTLRANFASAASIWANQLEQIKGKYPQERFSLSPEITSLLQKSSVQAYNVSGVETIEIRSEKTV